MNRNAIELPSLLVAPVPVVDFSSRQDARRGERAIDQQLHDWPMRSGVRHSSFVTRS